MKAQLRHMLTLVTLLAAPFLMAEPDGEELWMKNCKKCHGEDGKADTIMGKKFGIRDYTSQAAQAEFSDKSIRDAIVDGIENEDDRKVMISFGNKLSDEEVDTLVDYVRGLAPKEG